MEQAKRKFFDTRTYDRYLKKGVISQKEYDSFVKAMPDEETNSTYVEMDIHDTELSSDDDTDDDDDAGDH